MTQFKSMNPEIEVNGQTVLTIANGMGAVKNMGLRILSENNIHDPQPESWYSQQEWLNAFKQISEKIGAGTLFQIGKSIPENAEFPPHIETIEQALAAIDVAYHMNHRLKGVELFNSQTGQMTEGIGHYNFKKINDKKVEIICDNPYPCDFDKGIITAMARRFKPSSSPHVSVVHDVNDGCRSKGDHSCSYVITW
jgi:hypothetical protein